MSSEVLLGDPSLDAENLQSLAEHGELGRALREGRITQHFC
jgi:hypothetical protein